MLAADGIKSIVNLTQHPLARVNESYAFCHHGGWYECEMQTHALCSKQMLPSDPFAMYEYIECNFGNLGKEDADNTRLCAKNLTLAYPKLWDCATGYGPKSGPGLLLASAQLADSMSVNMAPTVFINGKQQAGVPQEKDLLKAICDAYTGVKPSGCSTAAALEDKEAVAIKQCHV